jgi:hypothetical protein
LVEKTLGVLLYIDDTPSMLEDFSWIYKSWIYSGNWRTSDLIAVCNPSVYDKLPSERGVVRIAHAPVSQTDPKWRDYPFINSIACLVGPHVSELAGRYTHFLRSDADVFLTRNLVGFRPNIPVHGRGRYAETADVQRQIKAFAERHALDHRGVFNCGHSLLATTDQVLLFLRDQLTVCGWLLEAFKDDPGEWPGWCRNVVTMYAAELVANHHWPTFLRLAYLSVLDFETCLVSDIDATHVVHIHAVNVRDEYWSKLDYRDGKYAGYDIDKLNRNTVNGYCHWIAETSVEQVKREAGYPE